MKKLQIILTYCNNHLARKTILVEVGYDLWDNFALREKLVVHQNVHLDERNGAFVGWIRDIEGHQCITSTLTIGHFSQPI